LDLCKKFLTANMMYTRSQNYTNMVIGEHEIQTFEVVVVAFVVVIGMFLSPQVHIPYYLWTSDLNVNG
jgi:hypothetical protein